MKLDRVLDLAFVVVCLAAVGVIAVRTGARPSTRERTQNPGIQVGDYLKGVLPISPDKAQTVLVIVNSQCKFCTRSMPFYVALQAKLSNCSSTQLRFVSHEPIDVIRKYLNDHDLSDLDAASVPFESIKGTPYPTIVVVDRGGAVSAKWNGLLNESRQHEIASRLACV